MTFHLDTGPTVTFRIRGYQSGARARERIKNLSAFIADSRQMAHEIGRLAGM